jgi:hypothetical protein
MIFAGFQSNRRLAPLLLANGMRAHAAAAFCVLLAAGCWTASSQAQSIYACKDESGRALTSDRPIPECAKRPMRELTSSGVTKYELPPPLTHEQIRQKLVDDERLRVANLQKAQENSRNRALLIAYPNLTALEIARKRHLEELDNEALIIERRMTKEHGELIYLQAEIKTLGPSKTPFALKKQIEQVAASILADNDVLTRMRDDIVRTNRRYDEDALRLKQLLRDPDEPIPSRAETIIGSQPTAPNSGLSKAPSKSAKGVDSRPLASR